MNEEIKITCPHCGSDDYDIRYDNVESKKFHFYCKSCNILIENTVTVSDKWEELKKIV